MAFKYSIIIFNYTVLDRKCLFNLSQYVLLMNSKKNDELHEAKTFPLCKLLL